MVPVLKWNSFSNLFAVVENAVYLYKIYYRKFTEFFIWVFIKKLPSCRSVACKKFLHFQVVYANLESCVKSSLTMAATTHTRATTLGSTKKCANTTATAMPRETSPKFSFTPKQIPCVLSNSGDIATGKLVATAYSAHPMPTLVMPAFVTLSLKISRDTYPYDAMDL